MTGWPADLAALRGGGKAGLARALAALETAADAPELAGLLDAAHAEPRGLVVGLTGPPGVGKSTLTGALVAALRRQGRTVGVIAIDPSSRRSRGALLGDRVRIATDPEDAGVFVRSMAARDRLGGLAALTFPAMTLMRAVFDWVLVETVGVGQSETEIAGCADLVVVCVQPGAGDALQFMKAGIVEVPDLMLVTKGDLGAPAERAAAELRGALSLSHHQPAPEVLVVSSQTGAGIGHAVERIEAHGQALARAGRLAAARRAKAAAWVDSQLGLAFGTEGMSLLAARVDTRDAPFAAFAQARDRLRAALKKARETL